MKIIHYVRPNQKVSNVSKFTRYLWNEILENLENTANDADEEFELSLVIPSNSAFKHILLLLNPQKKEQERKIK